MSTISLNPIESGHSGFLEDSLGPPPGPPLTSAPAAKAVLCEFHLLSHMLSTCSPSAQRLSCPAIRGQSWSHATPFSGGPRCIKPPMPSFYYVMLLFFLLPCPTLPAPSLLPSGISSQISPPLLPGKPTLRGTSSLNHMPSISFHLSKCVLSHRVRVIDPVFHCMHLLWFL